MINVWPFIPAGDTIETVSWLTEVHQSRASEQRVQLRQIPRRQFDFSHMLQHKDVVAAAALVASSTEFYVPDWTMGQIGAVPLTVGDDVVVSIDTTDLWIGVGSHVGWLKPNGQWDVTEVVDFSTTTITLASVSESIGLAALWLFDKAICREGVRLETKPGGYTRGSISLETAFSISEGSSDLSQYRGHDVFTKPPVVASGSSVSGVSWDVTDIDNSLGAPYLLRNRKNPKRTFSMRWHALTRSDIRRNRGWIFSRKGKLKAFWLPSFQNDMTAASGISSSSTTLTVFAPEKALDLGGESFDIEIAGLSLYRRRVTNVTVGSPVGGKRTLDLTLDTPLGVTHLVSQLGRINFLRCVRFDADRIEFSHGVAAGVSVAIPCIEVPVP